MHPVVAKHHNRRRKKRKSRKTSLLYHCCFWSKQSVLLQSFLNQSVQWSATELNIGENSENEVLVFILQWTSCLGQTSSVENASASAEQQGESRPHCLSHHSCWFRQGLWEQHPPAGTALVVYFYSVFKELKLQGCNKTERERATITPTESM